MDFPSSRKATDLTVEMQRAWHAMESAFAHAHPSLPQPFLTQTYRSPADQNAAYAQGRTVPGKPVTNAKAGQSLHNYYPSFAFDVAFKDAAGHLAWTNDLFQKLGVIAMGMGIGWGGTWKHFKDYAHFDPKGFTWEQAKAGQKPNYPAQFSGINPLSA